MKRRFGFLVVLAGTLFGLALPVCDAETISVPGKDMVREGIDRARAFQREWNIMNRRSSVQLFAGQAGIRGMIAPGGGAVETKSICQGVGVSRRLKGATELRLQIWSTEETSTMVSPYVYVFGSADRETRWIHTVPCSLTMVHRFGLTDTVSSWLGAGFLRIRYDTRRTLHQGQNTDWAVFSSRGAVWGYEVNTGLSWRSRGPFGLDLEVKYVKGEETINYAVPNVSGGYYQFINPGTEAQTAAALNSEGWRFAVDGVIVTLALRYYFQ